MGSKETLFALCVYGKSELIARIEDIVNKKALIKMYPNLALENSDKKILKQILNK